jgi:hypothetical protein
MGTFTVSVSSGVVNGTKNYTVSDADISRWLVALKVTTPNANGMSNAQILGVWADNTMDLLQNHVLAVEEAAAAANVVPISIT